MVMIINYVSNDLDCDVRKPTFGFVLSFHVGVAFKILPEKFNTMRHRRWVNAILDTCKTARNQQHQAYCHHYWLALPSKIIRYTIQAVKGHKFGWKTWTVSRESHHLQGNLIY